MQALIVSAAGVLIAAGAAAAAILLPPGRTRAAAMLLALVLFPLLILGDQWHTPQIEDLRDEPTGLIVLAATAVAAAAGLLAWAFTRRPIALPLAVVFALPFRVPLEAGGDTANLLVPLYLVIAGGVVAAAVGTLRARPAGPVAGVGRPPCPSRCSGGRDGAPEDSKPSPPQPTGRGVPPTPTPPAGAALWLPRALAVVVVLYALQTLYSPDFSKSLQNVCFFFVPFSLVYGLLREVRWTQQLLVLVLWVVALEAVAFVVVGSIEYVTKSLFWNDQVIRSNEFHTYFRVNSIFWDPNIYGRYLALVIVVATAALLWAKEQRTLMLVTALVAVLWLGLVPTFSQSSFVALLAGLAVLAALRWSWRWTLAAVGACAVLGVVIVLFAGGISKLSPDRINVETGGRSNLVSGGADLFGQRPLWGYGAGSFPRAYREHIATKKAPVSVSHTEPVTVAAEQGLIGLAAYAALIGVALWTMGAGLLRSRPAGPVAGGDHPPPRAGDPPRGGVADAPPGVVPPATPPAGETAIARAAVLAAFVALLVHTMAYAGFFEDPIAWVLLGVGASLASAAIREEA